MPALHPEHEQKIAALRLPGLLRGVASARNAELRQQGTPKAGAAAELRQRYELAVLLCAGPVPPDPALTAALAEQQRRVAELSAQVQQKIEWALGAERQVLGLSAELKEERAARDKAEQQVARLGRLLVACARRPRQTPSDPAWSGSGEEVDGDQAGDQHPDPGPAPRTPDAGDDRGGGTDPVDGEGRGGEVGLAGGQPVDQQPVEEQVVADGQVGADHRVEVHVEVHVGADGEDAGGQVAGPPHLEDRQDRAAGDEHQAAGDEHQAAGDEHHPAGDEHHVDEDQHQGDDAVHGDQPLDSEPVLVREDEDQPPPTQRACATEGCPNTPPGKTKYCSACRGKQGRARRLTSGPKLVHAGAAAALLRRTRKERS